MFTKYLAAALIGTALMAAPALAQNTEKADKGASAQTAQPASATGLWQGSKLIGMNVYNDKNEKVGDIKELMTDKNGKIEMVVIGVGGFLGMGSHDVAVKFSELKWVDEPPAGAASSGSARPGGTTGASGTTAATSPPPKKNYPDHAVLNATKDQLKAMPQFDYNK